MNGVQIIIVSALCLLMGAAVLAAAGAGLYDIGEARRARRVAKHPYARKLRRRPLVSIIILAVQDTPSLQICLSSLSAGRYRKYEVITLSHPKSRPNVQKVLKKTKGELVVLMDNPTGLEKTSLKQAVDHLALEPTANFALIEPVITVQPSVANLLYRFQTVAGGQCRKAAAAYGLTGWAGQPAIYRRDYLSRRPTASLAARLCEWSAALALIILGIYSIYLAAVSTTAYLLAILWGGLLLFLILAVWSDSRLKTTHKIRLTILSPAAGGLLYLSLLLKLFKSAARTGSFVSRIW